MEKYFGNAYRGDPGVPHTDPGRFFNIWIGAAGFSVLTWFNPYMWQLSNQFKYFFLFFFLSFLVKCLDSLNYSTVSLNACSSLQFSFLLHYFVVMY
ncbi:hypothetical protein E5676_scaffold352G002690 [Cucumis melo var. makuwa]|uniref:Uncharacterized protein n=1 Tax=Cucumis melo var. makuwa TaxID=1194695 RepID=A0A5D3DNH7_CUCMM|nr:hypothetical protein E6C27_scaffold236G003420 [Cucumis melo var. makuwa]TYK25144.1 hypothetical protein E5676_scaffold352G002690 [Cucumis melo var. makuwa]